MTDFMLRTNFESVPRGVIEVNFKCNQLELLEFYKDLLMLFHSAIFSGYNLNKIS